MYTHRASEHQAAKLVAALLRVARATAGLAESNGSLYRRVYDSRHLQADCQEPGSAPEPYARQSIMGYTFYRKRGFGSPLKAHAQRRSNPDLRSSDPQILNRGFAPPPFPAGH